MGNTKPGVRSHGCGILHPLQSETSISKFDSLRIITIYSEQAEKQPVSRYLLMGCFSLYPGYSTVKEGLIIWKGFLRKMTRLLLET